MGVVRSEIKRVIEGLEGVAVELPNHQPTGYLSTMEKHNLNAGSTVSRGTRRVWLAIDFRCASSLLG